jgi:ribosomal protein S18 acetylase RimI-like enzyme
MPDLLVKLYELPDVTAHIKQLKNGGIRVRRAMAYEKNQVVEWVRQNFWIAWASECEVAFSHNPITCFIATENKNVIGFACYECTCKNFFGPMGVLEAARNRGFGKALLLNCLHAMSSDGYAYAIIGGVNALEFYEKTVDAIEIPGSSPGIYRDRLT